MPTSLAPVAAEHLLTSLVLLALALARQLLLARLRPRLLALAARQVLLVRQLLLPLSPLLLLLLPRHVEHMADVVPLALAHDRLAAEHLPAPHQLLLLLPSAGAPAKKRGAPGTAGTAQPCAERTTCGGGGLISSAFVGGAFVGGVATLLLLPLAHRLPELEHQLRSLSLLQQASRLLVLCAAAAALGAIR